MTTRIRVADATCGHCKQAIESAVGGVPGVTGADLDLDAKLLIVRHDDSASADLLAGAITAAGYTPEVQG
jgi:copper chaperone